MTRFTFLTNEDVATGRINAINQWSAGLAEALSELGHEVRLERWQPGDFAGGPVEADVVVIPYNPFMWGRWGFAPRLVWDVFVARRSRGTRIALVVHEPYVPIEDAKSLLMGAWQRAQLLALVLLADYRFAAIELWATRLARIRPTLHLPSGSNVPDARAKREVVRAQLRAVNCIVVATLTTGNPTHLKSYVEATLDLLSLQAETELVYLRLGAGAPSVRVPDGIREISPGAVPLEELGSYVASADLLLAPFEDGVSTRRGSLMAGLCEGVCVLGTAGPLTDRILKSGRLELVDVGDRSGFAQRGLILARDDGLRRRAADSGRHLFEANFAWGRIAEAFLRPLNDLVDYREA